MATKPKKTSARETDDAYFLKLLIYFVIGVIWVKHDGYLIFPLGLVIGVIIAQKDHFAIDRKTEYLMLIIAAAFGVMGWGLWLPV